MKMKQIQMFWGSIRTKMVYQFNILLIFNEG